METQKIEHGNSGESVSVRRAVSSDVDFFRNLRNLPEAVELSESKQKVAAEDHELWFKEALVSSNTRLFVLQTSYAANHQKTDIGFLRFESREHEQDESVWFVSIVLLAAHRGKGVGRRALLLAIKEWEASLHGPHGALIARVHPQNHASRRLFEGAGFMEVDQSSGFLTLRRHQLQDPIN